MHAALVRPAILLIDTQRQPGGPGRRGTAASISTGILPMSRHPPRTGRARPPRCPAV